uniref:Uncharacterized protein n=1 Tax=Aegilops tauschii subsp. strangulata TaxID=200361 RepID=A0A453QI67_AEGTS
SATTPLSVVSWTQLDSIQPRLQGHFNSTLVISSIIVAN